MLDNIIIANKIIGKKQKVFIIAEAGVNHNGNINLAKKLIDAAKIAGVDAVKFQTFKSENLVIKNTKMTDYQKKNVGKKESQLKMLKKLELNYEDFIKLKKYCNKKKIIFLSTPHSKDAIDFLEPLVSAYKIGSGDLTNLPFLKKIAKTKKPIVLSTGMANLKEVREAINVILPINKKLILLHCTTNYPCPLKEVNLRAMLTLKKEFNLPVGYSDHTLGIMVPIMAVALGARILEKHFTLDKNLPGPDHKASLNPKELEEMVMAVRDTEDALGSDKKIPTENERNVKKFVRKSIVAKIDIPKGNVIKKNMLTIKRPGIGISPKQINKIIGCVTKKNIRKDTLINWNQL